MAFTPRSFTTILTDMIAYVQSRTAVSDFSVGSVARTLLEAAVLEDDEQYFQMVQLLDIFSYTTAAGADLDRRLSDFNIFREPAKTAFGEVQFTNGNLIFDQVGTDALSGSGTLQIFNSSNFPLTGFPYTIRAAEGTSRVQDLIVSSLNTASNTFTLSGTTTSDLVVGDLVGLVTGSSAYTVNIGANVQAPPTSNEDQKIYRTSEIATIAAGNFYSNSVIVNATDSGEIGNVGAGRINSFVGAAPFNGAGVTNASSITGGNDAETDEDFRARAVEKLQSLSRGTVLALKAESVGVTDSATGQRIISSNVLEDFAGNPDEVIVYVDDGTGLVPTIVNFPQTTLSAGASIADTTLSLTDSSAFPSSGYVLVDGTVTDNFVVAYVSNVSNVLGLAEPLTVAANSADIIRRVNLVSEGTEDGQRRFELTNPPIVRSTDKIWIKEPLATSWTLLDSNIDYVLNKGTGEFSIVDTSGLGLNTQVIASYGYYTNIIAEVQKVLEGDPNDSVNFPGVKAAGVFLSVEAPVSKRVTVILSITAETTFVESELAPQVQTAVEDYIRGLKIGDDVIRSRIIDSAHNVLGVRSVLVNEPTSDIVVLDNELPTAFDTNDNSLVTVLS